MKGKVSLLVFLLLFITAPLSAGQVQDFSFNDLNGKTYTWADLKGNPLVVNIGSHTWKKCKLEAPEVQRAYVTYKDQGVIFLGVFAMSKTKHIKKFVKKYQLTYPVGKNSGIAQALSAKGIPETIFINKEGEIVMRHSGTIFFDDLKAGIDIIIK